ncbi:P-loop containing nucleoside triphosphate hydrolase protein [Phanerochaete sordida]|uniref:P-loop containing nucleoside triphosphate hydrolase protein n=1 Tax=Phanerochaete sordida TaxID=48140 RepID=A0A9P3G5X2_9APHY|nr:P-loop containing nucleoside triphosphate hydrolase protein [Phanerochaete sordida]
MSNEDSVTIAIMGATGAGKSTFINLISGSHLNVGYGLESCTSEVEVTSPFLLDGKMITLIDTPGFDDTVKTEAEILRLIADFLSETYKQGRKLNGVIFLQRITDTRMSGVARKNFRLFRKLCGDDALSHVVIATNMWGKEEPAICEARERELATNDLFFKPALDKGARMVRHDNSLESAQRIIREIIGFPPAPLQIQVETVDELRPLVETDAGRDVESALQLQLQKYQNEVSELRDAMREINEARDKAHREELQELSAEMRAVQSKLARVEAEAQQLRDESAASRAEHEEQMRAMVEAMSAREAELRTFRERAHAQQSQITQMEGALQDAERRAQEEAAARDRAHADLKTTAAAHEAELARVRREAAEKIEAQRREVELAATREREQKALAQKEQSAQREAELRKLRMEAEQKAAAAKREAEAELARKEAALKAEAERKHAELERAHKEAERKADEARRAAELERAHQEAMLTAEREAAAERLRQELEQRAEEARREAELEAARRIEALKAEAAQREAEAERVRKEREEKAAKAAREAELERAREEAAQRAEDARRASELRAAKKEAEEVQARLEKMQAELLAAEQRAKLAEMAAAAAAKPPSPPPTPPPRPTMSIPKPAMRTYASEPSVPVTPRALAQERWQRAYASATVQTRSGFYGVLTTMWGNFFGPRPTDR